MDSKNSFCVLVCLLTFGSAAYGQFSGHYNALNITGSSNVLKTEIPLGPPATAGSNYLNDEWKQGEIVLKDGRAVGSYPVRIQIEHGIVEINVDNKPYTLNFSNVSHIMQLDEPVGLVGKVQMGRHFTFERKALKGVVMTHDIQEGTVKVMTNYYIEIKPSNYNVAMDVGSKVNQKLTKQKVFIQKEGVLYEIKGSNKKILNVLGYDKAKVREIFRANDFDLENPKDLVKFLTLMN
jgi:hypothetical protein